LEVFRTFYVHIVKFTVRKTFPTGATEFNGLEYSGYDNYLDMT